MADHAVHRVVAAPDGHLQGVEDEVGGHGGGHPPAHDQAGEDVDDEGHVGHARPGGDIGEVGDPQLVRTGGGEVPVDQVRSPGGGGVGNGGALLLAPSHPFDAQMGHEPGHLVPADVLALAAELLPQLVGAIDPAVLGPGVEDLGFHLGVPELAGRGGPCLRRVVGGGGDLQLLSLIHI